MILMIIHFAVSDCIYDKTKNLARSVFATSAVTRGSSQVEFQKEDIIHAKPMTKFPGLPG